MRSALPWFAHLAGLLAANQPAIRIVVTQLKGSGPREPGATMLVTRDQTIATIGGGHLEWQAITIARTMLQSPEEPRQIKRFALGATLGQCCGGAMELLFDRYEVSDVNFVRNLIAGTATHLRTPFGAHQTRALHQHLPNPESMKICEDALLEPLSVAATPLYLFGAGHVAKALVNVLATLPFRIVWIDARADEFPADAPAQIEQRLSDDPLAELSDAPHDAYFMVITHDHALDFELARAILKRQFAFFGMIGSSTKALKFRQRLSAMGYTEAQIARLNCPVGIGEIHSKLPAAIAISIAAQLLEVQTKVSVAMPEEARPVSVLSHAA